MGRTFSQNGKKIGCFLNFKLHLQARDFYEGIGVDGRIIFEWILKKYVSIQEIGLVRLKLSQS